MLLHYALELAFLAVGSHSAAQVLVKCADVLELAVEYQVDGFAGIVFGIHFEVDQPRLQTFVDRTGIWQRDVDFLQGDAFRAGAVGALDADLCHLRNRIQ